MTVQQLAKLYYRIGEVSEIVGVAPHVLRYWESEFRTIRPQKSNKGQRVYSRRDVERLLRVKDLLRSQGFTIAGARRRLRDQGALDEDDTRRRSAREARTMRKTLIELRAELVAMVSELRALRDPKADSGASSDP